MNLFWLISLAIAASMLFSGGQQYTTGAPVADWLVDVVAGVSFLSFVIVMNVGYRLESDQPSLDRIGLTDWISLLLFGSWIAISALLYLRGYRLPRLYFFAAMGGVGVAIVLYTMLLARD